MAAALGCEVGGGVTKHTTLLVVGDQDERKLAGYAKSAKHRKAETLIAGGQRILIVGEQDFRALADLDRPVPTPSTTRLTRAISEPVRAGLTWQERWQREDGGLIACWERGREMRATGERYVRVKADAPPRALDAEGEEGDAEAVMRAAAAERLEPAAEWAARGELRLLPWRGGVAKKLKGKIRRGSLQYLAMWQGLRGEDLDIDVERETEICCTWTRQRVVFSRAVPPEPEDEPIPTA